MAKKVTVPRAEVARLLGLPEDVDDATLQAEMEAAVDRIAAAKQAELVSAAEQRARLEDRTLVLAAVNDGRLPANRVQFWCDALTRDREGNREIIASLVPGFRPANPIADPDIAYASEGVKSALGRLGFTPAPRPVAAGPNPLPSSTMPAGVPVDSVGLPLPQVPPPVVYKRGTPVEEWTPRQREDALLRRLGQKFWPTTQAPPRGDSVYYPSPNDHSYFDETAGEWRPKPNNQARNI
jgi:hypothetical protein